MADDRLGTRRAPQNPGGRVPYVWVKDDTTGYEYDVPQTAVRDGMTPVDGVDLNYSRRPRPTDYKGADTVTGDERATQPSKAATVTDGTDTSSTAKKGNRS